jgi:hypothetical protein
MRSVTILSVLSSIILAAVAGCIITFTRGEPAAAFEPVNPRFLPGNPLPRSSWCERHYGDPTETTLPCHARQPTGRVVYLTYDTREQQITRTFINTPGKTVGELVLAWGIPTGYRNDSFGVYVYWQGRFVYSSDRAFKPESRAVFVAYSGKATKYAPWYGFRDLKRDAPG